jgi:hypothetical protein
VFSVAVNLNRLEIIIMAEKSKDYAGKFATEDIKNALREFNKHLGRSKELYQNLFSITNKKGESWHLDTEDDFFLNYQDDIKSANISYFYFIKSKSYAFSLSYRQNSFETSTSISVSLPSRSDIEMIFLLFDQAEEKYRTIISTSSTKTTSNKTSYSISRSLFATNVEIKLVSDMEKFLKLKSVSLSEIAPDTKWNYKLTIDDMYGSEDLSSIEDFLLSYFPDDTKSINISIGTYGNEVSIRFSLDRESSILKITVRSENSRQVVEGIAAEILQMLIPYKTQNGFFHPSFVIEVAVHAGLWGSLLYGLILIFSSMQISIILLSFSLILASYLLFRRSKPFNTFETRQNQRRQQWSSWLMFSVIEFILFTVFGGLILKKIFGF